MELRMYGLVNYQLSGIQKGIQFGHAVVDYGINHPTKEYADWAKNHKTFIILSGGTTNTNPEKLGSLNSYFQLFKDNGVIVQEFYEPDLGDQMTAFCFIVDERVFNKEKYPDFIDTVPSLNKVGSSISYEDWSNYYIGKENVFLRNTLKDLKLA